MVGSMRSCVADGRTDRQTDGAGYIGPAEGYGGSNNWEIEKYLASFYSNALYRVEKKDAKYLASFYSSAL